MMGRTHMALGFLAGILLFPVFNANWLLFVPLVTFGALLPDVDHKSSKINRMLPVTRWVPGFFKHRGFFHSVFPPVIIYIIFYYLNLTMIGLPLAIGYLTHLGSDCLTRLGCNLLHPVSKFRIQGFVYTNGMMELIIFGGVLLFDALLLIKHVV